MLSQTLRASRSILLRASVRPAVQTRSFIVPTAARQADLVQEIYLRELKAYKPTPEKASDAEGVVKKWAAPKTPSAPDAGALATELSAYDSQEVEVEGQAPGGAVEEIEDWFDEAAAFDEGEEGAAH